MRSLNTYIYFMNKLIFLSILLVACLSTKKITTQMNNVNFDVEGHRGCRGLMPENTIPAMLKALEIGVTTLEMDAAITKDRKVILSHDPYFNHDITTQPDGSSITEQEEKNYKIYQMNYNDVAKYDVGLKPHPKFPRQQKLKAIKPLLSDVIDAAEDYARRTKRALPLYNIETKTTAATDNIFHPAPEEFVNLLMKVIEQKKITERVTIQSFDVRTLQYLHKKQPLVRTALLIEEGDKNSLEENLKQLGYNPEVYSPYYSLVTASLIANCHNKGIKVIPWTVNIKAEIDRLKALGVDGIITDYPDLLQ